MDNISYKKRILCYAREAGGAEAVAPVVAELKKNYEVIILAKDVARLVFDRHRLPFLPIETEDQKNTYSFLKRRIYGQINFLFTSASSLPQNDMTDRFLWDWARKHSIKSLALLEQWQHYCERFSGLSPTEHMAYSPDRIAVMDEFARDEMIKLGFNLKHLVVTGHPAFDRLHKYKNLKVIVHKKTLLRKFLRIKNNEKTKIVVFASERIRRGVFKKELPYDETSVLLTLRDQLKKIIRNNKQTNIHLIIKPHPNNILEDFSAIPLGSDGKLSVQLSPPELSGNELAAGSDLVVGMSSILLTESAIIGLPVISFQPGALYDTLCILNAQSYIPFIHSTNEMRMLVERLLYDVDFRQNYLKKQTGFYYRKNAAKNVKAEIDRMLK